MRCGRGTLGRRRISSRWRRARGDPRRPQHARACAQEWNAKYNAMLAERMNAEDAARAKLTGTPPPPPTTVAAAQ